MLEILEYEGKTKEEALQKALDHLKCSQEDLFLKSTYIEGRLFKSAKYIVSVLRKQEVANYIRNYIKSISQYMNIGIETEINIIDDVYHVTLVSDQNAILIGREGRTLNAIQMLIKQSIKNKIDLNVKLNLDASNYKLKKLKGIEREVKILAEEVLSTQIDVSLDPMNSYERRLVHSIISEYENLYTESIGEGRERHVVIKYEEKK